MSTEPLVDYCPRTVADSTDLQAKVKAGADLVALGKENGFEFTQEELETIFMKQLQESDEGLTEFELDVVTLVDYGLSEPKNPKNQ